MSRLSFRNVVVRNIAGPVRKFTGFLRCNILKYIYLGGWRNWQTRTAQDRMDESP